MSLKIPKLSRAYKGRTIRKVMGGCGEFSILHEYFFGRLLALEFFLRNFKGSFPCFPSLHEVL